jgi:beta-N-acetylhexosaminidase
MQDPSLETKIGQMLLLGFRGLTVGDESPIVRDIRERHIGGVVLFDYDVARQSPVRNIQSPEQVAALTAALQDAAEIPLLVAIDQEGGYVSRLKEAHGFPPTVSAQELGALDDVEKTHQQGATTARTLAELGVNFNLAPVVDLNLNPDNPAVGRVERSFGTDPQLVIRHAQAWIDAHHAHGVLTCLKHFPGHGSSRDDTHDGFVDVTEQWAEVELEPYVHLIRHGRCDAVMTAHIFNAKLDPERPATLSHNVIIDLLREQMGYDGTVVTDDLGMRAISTQYGFETALQYAIEAGVDILTFGNNTPTEAEHVTDAAARAVDHIARLVAEGQISEERIDRSYQRIQALKQQWRTLDETEKPEA